MAWQALRRLFGSSGPAPAAPEEATSDAPGPGIYRRRGVIFDPTPAKLAIVGESFYQDALEALGGGRTERGVERHSHQASLMPEPENPKDSAAIAVLIEGRLVGYLSRENARAYRPVLDLVEAKGLGVGCHASLIGGWDRGSGDRGSIGVVLHLGSPAQLIAELRAGGVLPEAVVVDAQADGPPAPAAVPLDLGDLTGKKVCFTGESVCTVGGLALSRPTQEILATNAGLHVLPRVTKKLDVLVVSPLAERTGKVVKAELYGILRADEATFWRAIGVRIDQVPGDPAG